MSVSTEDFLKSIYQLKFDFGKKASSSNLAESLCISNAAVTDMAKKLAAKGLVNYKKYKEIALTRKGKLLALSILRRHRLWESFLSEVLSLSPNEVHKEAEILEHQTSDHLLNKIDEYLGHPEFDPHGDPIPDSKGRLPVSNTIQLMKGSKGSRYTIRRIQYKDKSYQDFFIQNKIDIGSELLIKEIYKEEEAVSVEISNKQIIFNSTFANSIHVVKNTS